MATFVNVPLASGGTAPINPETVDAIEDVPASLNAGPPACYVSFLADGSAARVCALGTAAAIAALLGAAPPPVVPVSSGTYAPTLAIAGGPIALLAGFLASFAQVGTIVTVSVRCSTTWASNGVGQITCSLPPGLPLAPGAVVQGVGTSVPSPYTAGPFGEPPPRVYNVSADMAADIANSVGAPLALDHAFVFQYETP
jgi:hypothetical protein